MIGVAAILGACGASPAALRAAPPPGEASPSDAAGLGLQLDHYALLVAELDRSAHFYGDLLGLPETHDATGKDNIRWFSLGDDRQLHLIETEGSKVQTQKGIHLALTTRTFDQLVAQLTTAHVPFESWTGEANQSNARPDGVRQIYLQDPDGYWIEINDAVVHWPTPRTP